MAHPYPWATFIINCTGSFALGLVFALHLHDWLWQLIGIGFFRSLYDIFNFWI
ncbi:CrcB family protein [Lysinibacillus sp. MHQ-1]|nr:CrcB family protein [Lysinibacillus sp. MHQ-1]